MALGLGYVKRVVYVVYAGYLIEITHCLLSR